MADHARAYPWDAASWDTVADYLRALDPTVVSETASAVLSLVEEQRAENERLREALKYAITGAEITRRFPTEGSFDALIESMREALAGSPVANEEQQ